MAKQKESIKTVTIIQKLIKEGKKKISKLELGSLGLDVTQKNILVRNVKLEKDLVFSDWYFSIIDKKADLDGNQISENPKLLKRIQNHYEGGSRTINFTELINDFNIYTTATDINIGNFNLNSLLRLSVYDINLIDKKKSISGKWIDNVVDAVKVKEALHKFQFERAMLKLSEVQLNKELESHFKEFFETVKKGDTTNEGLVDLNIGNGKFVIEMKLSREAKKSSETDRAVGQVDKYKKHFPEQFMIVVFGDDSDREEKGIHALSRKVNESKGIYQFISPHP